MAGLEGGSAGPENSVTMRREPLRGLLFDMDGVLYRGRRPLPGARALLAALEQAGRPFALVTNNSTMTPGQYARKLAAMGMPVAPGRIVTSLVGTVAYLSETLRPGAPVLVLGEPPFRRAVLRAGYALVWEKPAAVVVGLDRRLTYRKLAQATAALVRGVPFIASNPDPMLPTEDAVLPGAGALVAALRYATGREPVVIGKPEPRLLRQAMARIGTRPDETAMVGDQRMTDVAAGRAAGLFTVLVLTGVAATRPGGKDEPRADLTVRDLRELRAWLVASGVLPG